jgi:hypothetical protein
MEDEEREYMRRVELVQIAQRDMLFTPKDLEDLKYFLRVKEYFK